MERAAAVKLLADAPFHSHACLAQWFANHAFLHTCICFPFLSACAASGHYTRSSTQFTEIRASSRHGALTVEFQLKAQTFPFLPISGPWIFSHPPTQVGGVSGYACHTKWLTFQSRFGRGACLLQNPLLPGVNTFLLLGVSSF